MTYTIDPRIAEFITVTEGQGPYRLKSVQWFNPEESGGKHHIFFDVLDEDGNRLVGERIQVEWQDGDITVETEAKPGEPWAADYGMYAPLGSYYALLGDKVDGFGLGTPEEPDVYHHTSFGVIFVKGPKPPDPEPPDPEPPDPEPPDPPSPGFEEQVLQLMREILAELKRIS